MNKPEAIGIYLDQLVAREAAVIKRVIAFSSSQGRNYYESDLLNAQIVIVSDDHPVDFSQMNPQGSMIARITGQDSTEPYDVLMTRPLLVTRVMRTLDEAHALLSDSMDDTVDVSDLSPDAEVETETETETETEVSSLVEADDAPSKEVAELAEAAIEPTPVTGDNGDSDNPVTEAEAAPQDEAEAAETESPDDEVVEAEAKVKVPAQQQAVDLDDEDDSQHRALVVDDSAAIRKQLELELRDAGISADFAEDGEQAMEKVANNHYDLIFLDIIMPGIDGYETCRQMRMRAELKKTPIIMLSAKTSPLDEVQGVIAGASTYLTKPVKSEQLQSTLKRVSMWIDNFQAA